MIFSQWLKTQNDYPVEELIQGVVHNIRGVVCSYRGWILLLLPKCLSRWRLKQVNWQGRAAWSAKLCAPGICYSF